MPTVKLSKAAPSSIQHRLSKDSFFRMGYMHQAAGDLQSAAECYVRSIENGPNAEAHTFLGWVLRLMGNIDHAISECHKALSIDPQFGNAWNDIGVYLTEKHEFDKAVPFLRKAAKAKNYDHREYPHYNLARIYVHKGMLRLACQELEQSLKYNKNFAPAREMLSKLQVQLH